MKQLLSYIIVIIFFISCEPSKLDSPVNREHYFKLYGEYYNDYINSAIETDDGGLLLAGFGSKERYTSQLDLTDSEIWAYISKTRPSGMVEWDTTLDELYPGSIAHDVKIGPSESELLVSVSQQIAKDTVQLMLLPLSTLGEPGNPSSIQLSVNKIRNAVVLIQNDGVVRIVSQVEKIVNVTEVQTSLLIHNLTDDNKLIQTFEVKLKDRLQGLVRAEFYTNQAFFIGATVEEPDSAGSTDIRVIAFNENNISWDKIYGTKGVSETCSEIKIINNEIVIAGNRTNKNSNLYELLVFNVQLAGTDPVFIHLDKTLKFMDCKSFDANTSNNYVFTGSFSPEDLNDINSITKTDIFFIEATKDGKVLNSKEFGSGGLEDGRNQGLNIFSTNNNSYYLVGSLEPINNFDICIFKLNENGDWHK